MTLFSPAWWEAVGARAANTALAVLLPLVALLIAGKLSPLSALSMVAVAVLGVVATSLANLPEVVGKTVPLWRAVLVRTLKTFGQSLAATLVGVEVIEAIDWRDAGVVIASATLYTLLRTLKDYLPEEHPPVSPTDVESLVNGGDTYGTREALPGDPR